MKRLALIIASLLTAGTADAGNYYGCAICSYAQAAQYGIIRHVDGTYWNELGSVQYELGARQDNYSKTGWSQYFYAIPFVPQKSALNGYQPLATQGSSIYGYSETTTANYATPNYQASAAVYQIDAAQLTDQATRLAQQSLELAQTGQRGAALIYSQQLEIAKVQATGQAAAAALIAAKGPAPESVQRAITLTLQPDSTGHLTVRTSESHAVVGNASDPTDAFMTTVGNNCSKCHAQSSSNADARKHLRLEEFSSWDAKTFAAISTAVDGNKMPPHKPLSRADKAVVFAMETYINGGGHPTAPQPTPDPPLHDAPLPPPPAGFEWKKVPVDPAKQATGEQPPLPTMPGPTAPLPPPPPLPVQPDGGKQ
jgi:hypothetical protein